MSDDKKEVGKSFKFLLEALKLIKEKKEDNDKIVCPKCQGDLHYSRAKLNGHIWGKCQTQDCLSWMQ